MRPEDLKAPFPKTERQILIEDWMWYIPYNPIKTDFVFPGWEHPSIFGNNNPVRLEYCSGNGEWIAEKALRNPGINWVAVEIKFFRARKMWSKIKNLKLTNLFVVNSEGCVATERFFPDSSIEHIYINFPDPWPKRRHAKNRLIQPHFVKQLARILKPQGNLTFVTDDLNYSRWTADILNRVGHFQSDYPAPYFITDHGDYGNSFFETLWREQGRSIMHHQFRKIEHLNETH